MNVCLNVRASDTAGCRSCGNGAHASNAFAGDADFQDVTPPRETLARVLCG